MRALKRWDVSGTQVSIVLVDVTPDVRALQAVVEDIPDGTSTIVNPITVIVTYADGTSERIEVENEEPANVEVWR